MVAASMLFAAMGVCVKMASAYYGSGEIVMYRGLVGALLLYVIGRWRGVSMRTAEPVRHVLRSATGVAALALWFSAIAGLPLAAAMTLNYTSSLWLAVFLAVGSLVAGMPAADRRLALATVVGFIGVLLVLRPALADFRLGFGLAGLLSGMVSAAGYLQVRGLARAGEPEHRIVFYFSLGCVVGGGALAMATGWHAHRWAGIGWMLAVGLFSTAGQIMLTRAYARGSTLANASLQYLAIVFAFACDALLFGHAVAGIAAVGIVLVVAAGVAATMLRAAAGDTRNHTHKKPAPVASAAESRRAA